MHWSARLWRCGLHSIQNGASVDRETASIASIARRWLPKTVLEAAHGAFIDVLGHKTTTVDHDVGVSTTTITKVAEGSRVFVSS